MYVILRFSLKICSIYAQVETEERQCLFKAASSPVMKQNHKFFHLEK